MKLEVGMYVRTKNGLISKIKSFYCRNEEADIWRITLENDHEISSHLELKGVPSFNIIDLIEVGDYVNGSKVRELPLMKKEFIWNDYKNGIRTVKGIVGYSIENNDDGYIKTIVTEEQFTSMEYKVVNNGN